MYLLNLNMEKVSEANHGFLFEVIIFFFCMNLLHLSWAFLRCAECCSFSYPFYVPIPYSSGSCFLWFYPGGYAGCYEGLLAPDVLCQEEYDVHSDNFVLLLLGATWGHFCLLSNTLLHFCPFLIFLQLKRSINFAVSCVFCIALNNCVIVILSYEGYVSPHFIVKLQA